MKCENCAFWYIDVDEVIIGMPGERPYCHYSGDDQYAPCNLEDEHSALSNAVHESVAVTTRQKGVTT